MKLKNFKCSRLNGYLDFDLTFKHDVSFLIGINGSGKTSVLKATMALLGPDIDWLMNANYGSISVELEHLDKAISIQSVRADSRIIFSFVENGERTDVTITDEMYQGSVRVTEEVVRDSDGEFMRIRETSSELPDSVAPFHAVRQLPTPIFLGLDRTSLAGAPRSGPRRRGTPGRRTHATLRAFLDESVAQAEAIAVEAARHAKIMRSRRAEALREQILLTLFAQVSNDEGSLPRTSDIRRYERSRKSLKEAFSVLGIDRRRVEESIDPFYSEVIGTASVLSKRKSLDDVVNSAQGSEIRENFYAWMKLGPRVSLIHKVEEFVNAFNESEAEIFKNTTRYLSIMNSFLGDSKKELSFREDSSLAVRLPSGASADVYHLSSGERQLFVLITSLMFSDEKSRANAVIIDEPELSLHIKWQEMFVESLMEANPSIQLILATHSPSIILDRDAACVALT